MHCTTPATTTTPLLQLQTVPHTSQFIATQRHIEPRTGSRPQLDHRSLYRLVLQPAFLEGGKVRRGKLSLMFKARVGSDWRNHVNRIVMFKFQFKE
jgi:hypothetical protein